MGLLTARRQCNEPRRHWGRLLVAAAVGCSIACEAQPAADSPEQVVEEFVKRMRRVHGDPKSARAAYDLLWLEAQQNLAERAKRASALAGHGIAPEEMLAPSRFALAYQPKQYTSRVDGSWAEVTVTGEDPDTQQRSMLTKREHGRWRVVIRLPPLPPIQRRPKEAQ